MRLTQVWTAALMLILAMIVGVAGCSQESAKPAATGTTDPKPADTAAKRQRQRHRASHSSTSDLQVTAVGRTSTTKGVCRWRRSWASS